MKNIISIEYCTSWGYVGRALSLARKLLNEHKNDLGMVSLVPSSGGVFEIKLDDKLLFSKKELDRFPEDDEAENLIKEALQ